MTTPAKKRGYLGNVYLVSGGSYNQIESAGDIKVGDSWKTFEAPNRASPVIKHLPAMQDWSMEFKFIWDSSDTDLVSLRTAYRAGSAIDLWFADGPSNVAGSSGPHAEWLVSEWSCDMPLQNGMEVSVKCVPHANCSFEPAYLSV